MKGMKPIAIKMLDRQLANTPSVTSIDTANADTAAPVIAEPILPVKVFIFVPPDLQYLFKLDFVHYLDVVNALPVAVIRLFYLKHNTLL
jgi:hypothetical protein